MAKATHEKEKKTPEKEPVHAAWTTYTAQTARVEHAATGLKEFLSACKTEREAVRWMEEKLLAAGYKPIEKCDVLRPGDRTFLNWKGRALAAFKAGKRPVVEGFHMIGSHADSPRIDLKPKPLYEDSNLLMADTQYYGGLKKYQWANLPLALRGEIHTPGKPPHAVAIGENPDDPILLIPDLAPHLDRALAERKASETIAGENLDVILGHHPGARGANAKADSKDAVKKQIAAWIQKNWKISERELAAADLALVPAGRARDAGVDGSLVASYGIDDRICVWASFQALLDIDKTPEKGAFFLATDREEIGSCGLAGAQSSYMELFVLELLARQDRQKRGGSLDLRRAFSASSALSADVTEAANPLYKDAFDPRQIPLAGNGITIMKYSGSGGKYNGGEARGEFLARLIDLFTTRKVPWQVGSMGKVDKGGGGTIAMYLAQLGMDVADCGPAVLSLHSPWEMISKADVLATYDACKAFWTA